MELRIGVVMLVLSGLAADIDAATRSCKDDWICIEIDERRDAVAIRAVNLQPYPLTFSLRVRGQNQGDPGSHTITQSLQGQESRVVMSWQPRDAARRGNYRFYYEWAVGDRAAQHDDDTLYQLPYSPGERYRVLQGFGSRFSHTGKERFAVDFRMTEGTPVHAARGGTVVRAEASNSIGCWKPGCGDHANFIVILHDDGTTGEYYHLQQHGVLVEEGQRVRAGKKIGLSGNTGHSTLPHLHFAVYRAAAWGTTESIPFRFLSADGIITKPRRGDRYRARAVDAGGDAALPQSANRRVD